MKLHSKVPECEDAYSKRFLLNLIIKYGKRTFFCSELVAAILKKIGLLD